MNDLPETFWAWFAGILDGEGCFQIQKHKKKAIRIGYGYSIRLSVQMCEPNWIPWMQEKIGIGGVVESKTPHGTPIYRFCLYANQIREVLPRVMPYLRVKKEHAEILQEALTSVEGRRGIQHTPEYLKHMDRLDKRISALAMK